MAYTKTEQGKAGFTITQAAKMLGLTFYEFQYRRRQGTIEAPKKNQGGLRRYYSQEQLDRIKEQLATATKGGK